MRVYLTMTEEGIVWRDEHGRPTYHLTHEDAQREAEEDQQERNRVAEEARANGCGWMEPDPIDEVVAGTLNADGTITLDDGQIITTQQ
jgi:hypothetical protein